MVEKDVVPGVSVMTPPGPVMKTGGVVCEPVRVAPALQIDRGQQGGEGLAVGGLGLQHLGGGGGDVEIFLLRGLLPGRAVRRP